jgi:lipopolysaccharide transport system ATP-binding protein
MSDPAIQADALSKCYRLGEFQKYKALRDSLSNLVAAPFRRSDRKKSTNVMWALKDVSLNIDHGEVVGLIGRNGAGKSTLLRVLSRITEPTSGHARIRGRVGSLLEVGTGFHPELTGRENIYLSGAILGMRKREIQLNFDAIVDFAEVSQFIDTPIKFYSSGMYVRLAFAVAAHLEPEILLVDEVLAVGDAAFQKKCLRKMGDVAKTGRTVVFVSHNMGAIQNLCSVAHLLSGGRLVASGPVQQVVDRYLHEAMQAERQSLSERTDRTGNGKLILTEFSAAGVGTNPTVMCGSPAHFEIRYRGTPPLRHVQISVGFYNPYGEGTLYLSNDVVGREFADVPAEGTLICKFDRIPLMPGSYTVNLYCTVNGILADWVRDAARVNVEDGDYYGSGKLPPKGYGSVVVPHDWSVR